MKDLIVIGSGALGQEVIWLVEEINNQKEEWKILGFLDDGDFYRKGYFKKFPCLGTVDDYKNFNDAYFVIAFGDPRLRRTIYDRIDGVKLNFASLISPTVRVHESNILGKGVIIGRYSDFTVNCFIDDFAYINIHVVLGHEVKVGKFSIISPNVTVNGGANIGDCCQIGANAFVKDITIGNNSTIGASSCVIKDVPENCVVAGIPAKILHQGKPNKSISRDTNEI
jgi:sugar O-acyltransferase (sialic acid O-acetyltransferase NeuD family)